MRKPTKPLYDASTRISRASALPGASAPHARSQSVQLVVVEDGANALADHALPDGTDQLVSIAQGGGERPLEFANRAIRRILALEDDHRSIVGTVLLLSPRFDAEATAARVALARKLRLHAKDTLDGSELVLSAGSELHAALQDKVVALADVLMGDPSGRALPITVQFASSDPLGRLPRAQLSNETLGEPSNASSV